MTLTTPTRRGIHEAAAATLSAGLLLAAVGLVIQIATGVPGFPPVPPGPIILTVAAVFVAVAPWRWAPIVGLVAAVFLTVGVALSFSSSGTGDRLGDTGAVGPFIGTMAFMLGLLVALVAGIAATARLVRRN